MGLNLSAGSRTKNFMSDSPVRYAPGWPGISPRWTSSAKTGAGTALDQHSKVWFTLSHGILNEVYFPRVDQACTRDLGFIVTNGLDFFSEEKRHCTFENKPFEPGIPGFELTNTEIGGRYRIHKEVFTDPFRNVVLQKIRFEPLQGQLADYHLYALLSPHLANCGYHNTGWVGDYKGVPMFFAGATEQRSPSAARRPGKKCRSDSWAPPTDGRTSLPTSRWSGNTSAPRMATLPARERSTSRPAPGSSCCPWASAESGVKPDSTCAPACLRTTTVSTSTTSASGGTGRTHCSRSMNRNARRIFTAPQPQSCARMSPRIFWAGSSPASRSRGASIRATKTSVAITWSGRAIWSRLRERCWPPAPLPRRSECFATSNPRRKPPATGRRISGSTGALTGAGCRWTRRPFPSCCSICCAAKPRPAWESSSAGGPWFAKLRVLSCATVQLRSRIAGKKTRVTLLSRWRRKFPRCWLQRTSPN